MKSPSSRRARNLNLLQIRFPVGAIASASHRISGAILLLSLPVLVEAFARSLSSEAAYEAPLSASRSPFGIIALLLPCWAIAQHVFAGIRHLPMDVGIGSDLPLARRSAWAVLAGGALGTAILLGGCCQETVRRLAAVGLATSSSHLSAAVSCRALDRHRKPARGRRRHRLGQRWGF